jgi:hypothetical protein
MPSMLLPGRIISFLPFILCCLFSSGSAQSAAIAYRIQDRWGYADTLGNILITPAYDEVYKGCLYNTALVVANNKKWGAVSRAGKVVVPLQFDRIQYLNDFMLTENVVSNVYLYGLYDAKGKLLLPPEEQEINLVNKRWVVAHSRGTKKRSGVGLLNTKTKGIEWIIPRTYNAVYFNSSDSVFVVETDVKRVEYQINGLASLKKISEVAIEEEDIVIAEMKAMDNSTTWRPMEEFTISLSVLDTATTLGVRTKALVKTAQATWKKQRKIVLTDCENIQVVKYPNGATETSVKDKTRDKTNAWAIVRKNGKYGAYFSVPQEAFIPCQYDSIYISTIPYGCDRSMIMARVNGKWGIIGMDNKPVTGFLYDDILFQDSHFYGPNYRICFFFKNQGMVVKTGNRFNILIDSTRLASATGFDTINPETKTRLGMVLFDGPKKGLFREGHFFSPAYTGVGTFDDILSSHYPLVAIVDANQKLLGFADRKGILYFRD